MLPDPSVVWVIGAKTRAARAEVHRLGEATVRLRTQADAARTQLERDADALASTVVERVLGRKAS